MEEGKVLTKEAMAVLLKALDYALKAGLKLTQEEVDLLNAEIEH